MWKTPNKTTANTTVVTTPRPQSLFEELGQFEGVPSTIALNPKYKKLYTRIHSAHSHAFKSIDQDQKDQNVSKIRDTINDQLHRKSKQRQFSKKFGVTSHRNYLETKGKGVEQLIGVTSLVESQRLLNNFLSDHRQAVELDELTRLTEYYLKDQQKVKTNTDYLQKIQLTSKHQRLAPRAKNRSEIFTGSYPQYAKQKKIFQINKGRNLQVSYKTAKKNPTYRRGKNFAQTQYIIQKDTQNIIAASQVHSTPEQQAYRSTLRRIFIQFATCSESLRVYYDYIEGKNLSKLCEMIIPPTHEEQIQCKVTEGVVNAIIKKIMKYKFTKVLHFEDFRELLETLIQKSVDYNPINQILKLNPNILQDKLEKFQKDNSKQIEAILHEQKIAVALRRLYVKYQDQIVAKHYLPLNTLTDIMKKSKLLPKTVTMSKFMYTCYWNKRRREGFNIEEFMKIQVTLGLCLDCSLQGIQKYLKMFKLDQLVLIDE